jgi:gliding motility-associated-like protein
MKIIKIFYIFSLIAILGSFQTHACSPCQALSNVTQTLNGTNLELTFTSNAGWNCCYTVNIELICANASFSGTPNYFSQEICINGGGGSSTSTTVQVPYPTTIIDLSGYCPGNYKWRAVEQGCGIYTPEYQFTLGGSSPIQVLLNASQDTICKNQTTLLSSAVSNGCNSNNFTYSWSPAVGLNNASLANPVATPATTTTYSLTVSEAGSCTLPQTSSVTIVVNPLPTASIAGTISVCQNDASPTVTFSGASGTAPYTINYSLNGIAQTPVIANTDFSITPPTDTPGTFIYSLVNIQDASNTQCFQNQTGNAVITVNQLPVISAGADQVLCEPNDQTPSTVTLLGSGGASYVWDNGVTDGVAFIPPLEQTTTYTVIGTDANGCTGTDQVVITSLTLPIANALPSDTLGNVPFSVNFSNLSAHASNYAWDFGNGSTQNTTSIESVSNTYLEPGIYTVTLVASNGICSEEWNTEIIVLPPMTVEVPNIFTPNDDKLNDFYLVNVKNSVTFEATITNRWGEIMYQINSAEQMWDGKLDGKPVSDDVYFIQYKAVDYGGITNENHTFFHLNR